MNIVFIIIGVLFFIAILYRFIRLGGLAYRHTAEGIGSHYHNHINARKYSGE
ncbi:MAG: hypothetical protein J7L53_07415 [Deltaproteobacteria bacterium]|nr:hypothetical protein [Deltaproteobacteria bacterium]